MTSEWWPSETEECECHRALLCSNQLWLLHIACGLSLSRLTRQFERLDRNAVNAKKFDAKSVESHSMPGGHTAGVVAPSQRALYTSFFFPLKCGIAVSLTINTIPYIILQLL